MKWVLAIAAAGFPMWAGAQMDAGSRDLLIQKLTQVNLTLAPADSSKVSVTLRLADLLAERARISAMKDLNDGCTTCTAGFDDREKAILLYREVVDRVPQASRGKVLIQLGHLFELTAHEKEALAFYEKVSKETTDNTVIAEAQLSIAEMAYKKNHFFEARAAYRRVLTVPTAMSKGLAAYRSAWCSYNMGETKGAIQELIHVLQTPQLLTRTGTSENVIDPQFKEEVSRDLALFMAKNELATGDVEKLYELSPETTQVSNVTHLASEAERVGRKKEALAVWNFVFDRQVLPAERIEALLHRAPLLLDAGEREKSLADLQGVRGLWGELKGCGKADCTEPQKSFRQFIVVWNQAEKKTPSSELSRGYGVYLEVFPKDGEMALWGAEVAKHLKDWNLALARQNLAVMAFEETKVAGSIDKMEAALLGGIETAEASSDDLLLLSAQDFYLAHTVKGSRRFEVQYQKAHRLYDNNKHQEAATEMRKLALDPAGNSKIRKQAADLALDSLAILKQDDEILSWSREFASTFKDQAAEFLQVGQKAILTKAAALSEHNPQAAWDELAKFDSSHASEPDHMIYFKNRLILAEKTGNFSAARNAATDLLAQKSLTVQDREFALGRQAWLAELQLDFAAAFKATEQMRMQGQAPDQKALKLALFADLSGQNPVPLYQQYLKTTKDVEAKQAVASEIVRRSSNPALEIETQKSILIQAPDLLGRLYTEIYAKTPSELILKKAAAETKIQKTDGGRLLLRVSLLKDFDQVKSKLSAQQLDSSTQAKLGKSIKARAADLTRAETLAERAIASGDWGSQIVTIDLVAKESGRFYQELMSLPMPEKLSAEEEQQYMTLLNQQASPFKTKAELAQAKVKEFWSQPNWKAELEKSVAERAEFRTLQGQELSELKSAALPEDQAFFVQLETTNAGSTFGLPDLKEIEAIREQLRQKPMDRALVQKLLQLEKQARNFAMVQYLEGRLRATPTEEVHQ